MNYRNVAYALLFAGATMALGHLADRAMDQRKYDQIRPQAVASEQHKPSELERIARGVFLPDVANAGEAYAATMPVNEKLKLSGWDVYDTLDKMKVAPQKVREYWTPKDKFQIAWNSRSDLRDVLQKEKSYFAQLMDDSIANYEMVCVTVTSDDYLHLVVKSDNPQIGKNGFFFAYKKLSNDDANIFRSLSPKDR